MNSDKRFTLEGNRIKDNQSPSCYIEYYNGLISIVHLLNKMNKENQELKKENEQLIQFKNLAIDYNIPFDKLYDTFESLLEEGMNK